MDSTVMYNIYKRNRIDAGMPRHTRACNKTNPYNITSRFTFKSEIHPVTLTAYKYHNMV